MNTLINLDELSQYIVKNRNKHTTLTFHSVGDRDGVAAAVALSKMFVHPMIVTPDFITNNAKRMLERSGCGVKIETGLSKFTELVVVLDANRMELLGKLGRDLVEFRGEILFIDHHAMSELVDFGGRVLLLNDETYNSASSIVYEVLRKNNVQISKEIAFMLINGIVADSADFQNASAQTFEQIGELLDASDLKYTDVVETEHGAAAPEIRNKIMKDLFSAKTEVCGNYLLVYGKALFQANTASETALRLGADAALFWSLKNGEVSLSARLRAPLDRRLGIHMGKIMTGVGPIIMGNGGGHPCAAGAYGKKAAAVDDAVKYVIDSVRAKLLSENV